MGLYRPSRWTREYAEQAQAMLREEAAAGWTGAINRTCQRLGISVDALRKGLASLDLPSPSEIVHGPRRAAPSSRSEQFKCAIPGAVLDPGPPKPEQQSATPLPRDVQRLVDAIRSGPREFRALCDRLDLAPSKCEALIEQAEELGVQVAVAGNAVGLHWRTARQEVLDIGVPPTVGDMQRFAVLADPHFGSKYCMRAQIADFVDRAYDMGCTEVAIPGDFLTGCYSNQRFEHTHHGLDDQADDAGEHLPQKPGMTYRAITGNHDFTFAKEAGICVGSHIQQRFERFGRTDVKFYGDSARFIKIHGVVVYLFHPLGGKAYARSYKNQKMCESFTSVKPQILVTGHYHMFDHCTPRGIQAICCPCFQGGQSAFGKSLPGAPDIGGLIPEFKLTEHGTIREFNLRHIQYFERETIVEVRNPMPGIEVPPAVSRSVAVPDTRWQCCSG